MDRALRVSMPFEEGSRTVVGRDAGRHDHRPGDQAGLYVGARDVTVYTGLDDGDCSTQIAAHLPDVLTVRAAVRA